MCCVPVIPVSSKAAEPFSGDSVLSQDFREEPGVGCLWNLVTCLAGSSTAARSWCPEKDDDLTAFIMTGEWDDKKMSSKFSV